MRLSLLTKVAMGLFAPIHTPALRNIIFCVLFCLGIHVTQAQQGQWTPGVNSLYTDNPVGLGTTSFTAKLHIADGSGGEQLRLTRGTGSIRFAQDINKDNLYLFNSDASKTFMFWKENGNVGIGTNSPQYKLDVNGDSRYTGSLILEREGPNAMLRIKPLSGSAASRVVDFFDSPDINNSAYGVVGIANSTWGAPLPSVCFISSKNGSGAAKDIMMWANDAPSASNVALTIKANTGNIGIGTTNPGSYRLAVEGMIGARKVKVTTAAWADYVFHPTYRLRPLSEVEDYIQKHHHLPEVPSAAEVEQNGLDLGDNQATLLKKIEELTLYLIELNKRIEKLEAANEQLRLANQNIKSNPVK